MNTTTKTQWAVRTTDENGEYTYHASYVRGWGTRFQNPPVPYSEETAKADCKNIFRSRNQPIVVHREVVVVEGEWEADGIPTPPKPEPEPHERWSNVDWDDRGGVRGYESEPCTCATPWQHRP